MAAALAWPKRQGRRHWRDLAAISAADGVLGIEAIKQHGQQRHQAGADPEGKNFFDTGVALVTDKPAEGVESISVAEGTNKCWG
jgi:hypothetical protein